MRFNDLIGPSYRPSAYSVESQLTRGWYTEKVESGKGKSPFALLRTPGRQQFCDPGLGAGTVRAEYSLEGHMWSVVGDRLIEVFADGTSNVFPLPVGDDGLPAYITGNPNQLFVVSAGEGFILDFGVLHVVPAAGFPHGLANGAGFLDGYFITTIKGTQLFAISDVNDGNEWDAAERGNAEAQPDFIQASGVLNNEFWQFGSRTIQVFDDTGDLDFPFAPRQDVTIAQGIYAPASLTSVGGSWYFLAGNQEGQGIAARMSGYSVSRVSDHGFEAATGKMVNFTDAVGMSYLENGHLFWQLYFPSANQAWCYDVSTDQWHERSWLDPTTGLEHAHRGYCMTSAFGKILVGDRADGKIYEQSMSILDDGGGQLIRRTRRTPVFWEQLLGISHHNLVIDGNMGIGDSNITDVDDPMYDPQMMMRYSDDGGKNWSPEKWRGFGRGGEYGRRGIWRRNGYARRRVYEIVTTAPADWAIAGAGINVNLDKS